MSGFDLLAEAPLDVVAQSARRRAPKVTSASGFVGGVLAGEAGLHAFESERVFLIYKWCKLKGWKEAIEWSHLSGRLFSSVWPE